MMKKICYFLYLRTISIFFESFTWVRGLLISGFVGRKLDSLVVRPGVVITGYKGLSLGHHVSINHNCVLSCDGGLEIGDYVSIAHGSSILTTEHGYTESDVPIKYQEIKSLPVKIGRNVWIGTHVTILAGVTIADGTVIAAGAVVKDSISSPNTIVGGIPAKHIKDRF